MMSNHWSSPWRTAGPSGSFEMGASGKITHASAPSVPAACSAARLPYRPEPSVVTMSQVPALNFSIASGKVSTVSSVIDTPATAAPSVMFFSVVVPAFVQTVAPSTASKPLRCVKPDRRAGSPISCWPS